MPFNNWPSPQRKYLSAVEKLEEVLDEDEHAERGDEKDKTGGVILS